MYKFLYILAIFLHIQTAVFASTTVPSPSPTPICGNGITNGDEECDDGNNESGDGCDACQLENCASACSNDDSVCSDNTDCEAPVTCPTFFTTFCRFGSCSVDADCPFGTVCIAGSVCVESPTPTDCSTVEDCPSLYFNCIESCDPVCGDGIVNGDETCDDGNVLPGDGCSELCLIESGPACGNGVIEESEECDDGNTIAGDGCDATCNCESPTAFLDVTLPSSTFSYAYQGVLVDYTVTISSFADFSLSDTLVTVSCVGTVCMGTYFIAPSDLGSNIQAAASLVVTNSLVGCSENDSDMVNYQITYVPVCGNGYLDAGEDCDDGNVEDGDGCSAECAQDSCCTYTQGYTKNIEKPPLNVDFASIEEDLPSFANCSAGCAALSQHCIDNLLDGNCTGLEPICNRICDDPSGSHTLSYPANSQNANDCTKLAGQFWAFVFNLYAGGEENSCVPPGSSLSDTIVEALAQVEPLSQLDIYLCDDSSEYTESLEATRILLDSYNSGEIGPGHCPTEEECATVQVYTDANCLNAVANGETVSESGQCVDNGAAGALKLTCDPDNVHTLRVSEKGQCKGKKTNTDIEDGVCTQVTFEDGSSGFIIATCSGCPDFELQGFSEEEARTVAWVMFIIIGVIVIAFIIWICMSRRKNNGFRPMPEGRTVNPFVNNPKNPFHTYGQK